MKTKTILPALGLAVLLSLGLPLATSSAYVAVSVGIAPPAIPVYSQPLCPAPGYIWSPGYWAYGDFGYYWVPGTWVYPPQIGFLWTPGYWGYGGGNYVFHQGYWGPSVGFYGGINYGYGYYGSGYYGGEWVGSTFRYNTAVSRVNTKVIHNTYVNREVVKNATGTRRSFNGPGGVQSEPNAREQAAAKEEHVAPTSAQQSRAKAAMNEPALRAGKNEGKPKATAVRTFQSKHQPEGAETATAAKSDHATREDGTTKQTQAGKKANSSKQARAEKTNERATKKTTARSTPSAKTTRSKGMVASDTHKTTQTRHNEPRKTTKTASSTVHHAPVAPSKKSQATAHRPQVASSSRAPTSEENGKKKKKKRPDNG